MSSEDRALLGTLAAHAATAIEAARLLHEVRRRADEIERLHARQERILESSAVGLLLLDGDGRIQAWNRALEEIYGLPRDEAVGRRLVDVLPAARRAAHRARVGARHADDRRADLPPEPDQPRATSADVVNLSITWADADGDRGARVVTFDDVTERVAFEEQAARQERLASLGLLAAGVAHEINTPLTGISSYAQLLLDDLDDGDRRKEVLRKIEQQTERAAGITRLAAQPGAPGAHGLRVGRPQRHDPGGAAAVRAPRAARRIAAGRRAGRRPAARARPPREAAAGAPEPAARTRATRCASRGRSPCRARAGTARRCSRWRTTGSGSPRRTFRGSSIRSSRPRAAARARGSACRSATGSCASTTARSTSRARPDEFTRFRVELPLAAARPARWLDRGRRCGQRDGPGVLVVDDEPVVADVLRDVLGKDGHEVVVAQDGASGRARWRTRAVGRAAARRHAARRRRPRVLRWVREHDPDLAVVMITAFGTVENAVLAMKLRGVPLPDQAVQATTRCGSSSHRAVQTTRLRLENKDLRRALEGRNRFEKYRRQVRVRCRRSTGSSSRSPRAARPF